MEKSIKIKYIYNSGFRIDIAGKIIFFDYYKGNLKNEKLKDDDVTFFVSHHHKDHFNKKILSLANSNSYKYILSDDFIDLKKEGNISYLGQTYRQVENKKELFRDNISFVKAYQRLFFKNMEVKTFSSTDLGVSYLITVDGVNIFHAGDLNLWLWEDDPEEEKQKMMDAFRKEINKIKLFDVDIAFFPLDPRLGDTADLGLKTFIEEVKPEFIFPMHFGTDMGHNINFYNKNYKYRDIFKPIIETNQEYIIHY